MFTFRELLYLNSISTHKARLLLLNEFQHPCHQTITESHEINTQFQATYGFQNFNAPW